MLATTLPSTSVLPLRAGSLDGHRDRVLVKVDVSPTEAQHLALPKDKSYRYDPSAGVPSFKSDRENLRNLVSVEGLDLFLFDSWWLGDESRILREIATYHCLIQSSSNRPMDLVGGTC
jgi:hypothetical protein